MLVYGIDSRDGEYNTELCCRSQLPFVRCKTCTPKGGHWGYGIFSFPAVQLRQLDAKKYRCPGDSYRVVSVEEFRRIRARIEKLIGHTLNLIPGCCIGKLEGISHVAELRAIEWRASTPIMSRRTVESLADAGIHLETAEIDIRYRNRRLTTHLAVQVEPVALMTDETLAKEGIARCQTCGHFLPPKSAVRYPGDPPPPRKQYLLRQENWPAGRQLAVVEETAELVATTAFLHAAQMIGLDNIKFSVVGELV